MCAYLHIYIICMILFVHSSVCVHETSRSNKPSVQTCVCVCVCVCAFVFCAWVLECYAVCVCVCVHHISIINHESSNSSWWLSAQSSVTHTTNQNQNKRRLPVWLCTGFSLGYIAPAINYISGLTLCNLPELHVFGGIQYPSLLQEAQTNLKNWKTHRSTAHVHTWWSSGGGICVC